MLHIGWFFMFFQNFYANFKARNKGGKGFDWGTPGSFKFSKLHLKEGKGKHWG